jgi:hypothetical protein
LIVDDDIWIQFLENLNQETELSFPDEEDDPDFTVIEQENELDYETGIRVPSKLPDLTFF